MDEINNQYYPAQNYQTQTYTVTFDHATLKNMAGWATFKAIMDIIAGIFASLSIIGAMYGVPLIIAGVKLLNACENFKGYIATNDIQKISESFTSLNKFFKLTGISIILKIVFVILLIIIYVALIALLVSSSSDFLNEFGNFDYSYNLF